MLNQRNHKKYEYKEKEKVRLRKSRINSITFYSETIPIQSNRIWIGGDVSNQKIEAIIKK